MILCGELKVQGAAAHRLALPLLPYSGTLTPSEGMENVCPTPLPLLELMTRNVLPLSSGYVAVGARHLAELLVTQGTSRVVVVDRDVDPGVLGHLEDGGVHPLPVGRPDEVGHPGRVSRRIRSADRLQRDVDRHPGSRR